MEIGLEGGSSRFLMLAHQCIGLPYEIIHQVEKLGCRIHPAKQLDRFRQVINQCGFHDLGFIGSPFT